MSVLMMPGLSGTAAMPGGNSCASDWVSPSIAHFVAQYGATSASVERPQPELKFTMSPGPCDHRRHKMADDVRHALDVDVNHVGKFLRANLPERRVAVDERGVVEQQIRRGVRLQKSLRPRGDFSSDDTSTTAKSFGAGNCFCNCAISFSDRPQPITVWPSRTNSSAIARPSRATRR